MKKSNTKQRDRDQIRLSRLYGCGVPGLKRVSKASKKNKDRKSQFSYHTEDWDRVNLKLKSSEFFISNGVEGLEGYEHYYISLPDLRDVFEKSFQVKFSRAEIAAYVQEMKCIEIDNFREIRIIFNRVLKELKLLGNTLRSQNHSKKREDNEALLEFRKRNVESHTEESIEVHLEPSAIFNTLWEIHDACREHWELKTKKFMELLHKNFNTPTGVVDGEKLREFLWYNLDAKVTAENCKMLIFYLNGLESRFATTIAVHRIVMTLKLLAQDRHCLLTPPAEDEEAYNNFCATVDHIQKTLTNESRSSRIANRTMNLVKDEEKKQKKNPPNVRQGNSPRNNVQDTQKKNPDIDMPRVARAIKYKKNEVNTTQLKPIEEKVKKVKHGQGVAEKREKEKNVGFSSILTSQSQNEKSLAPYVAHSTDVSKPGGSSILRAKTPLILDRPANIRDHMTSDAGIADEGKTSARAGKKAKKESRLELCPVQLDEKGRGLRYDLRYRTLANFIKILNETRKVNIDDVLQAFWAKKQCEVGIGLDIISENGVTIDRKSFVEVLSIILPRFFEANTLFSVLDPNRSGFVAIHVLHILVSLYSLRLNCETVDIINAMVRAATWEILNCRLHQKTSSKLQSTLSTAKKASNAAQIAAKKHLDENAAEMQEKELKVKLEANNTRMKEHLRKRVAAELLVTLNEEEKDNESPDMNEKLTPFQQAEQEAAAIRNAFLPPGILNAAIRTLCTSPESEKKSSLSLFIMIKKAQAENIWDEDFLKNNRGYTRDDISVGFAINYLNSNEDENYFLREEFAKMHAILNTHMLVAGRKK